jgi:alpha-1,3-rhamnosyltransferase
LITDASPLVSVLLPSFNHVKYVVDAINSVVNQTYKNIELIVIDDGSTDGSAEKIAELAVKYGFTFIRQENIGCQRTVIKLVSLASGKYISLFSSDDVYELTKIEKLVQFMESNPQYAMVHSKIRIIDSRGNIQQVINEPCRSGNVFGELLRADFHINGISALVKTDVYRNVIRHNDYVDDLPVWLEIARQSEIGFYNEVTARYRIHNNHLTSNASKMQKSEAEVIARYKDSPYYPEAALAWNVRWFCALADKNKREAVRLLFSHGIDLRVLAKKVFYKGMFRLIARW